MASSSSSVLLVAVVLAAVVWGAHGIPKVPPGPNITASPASYGNKWLDAKTTWYGKPTGAGPKDNGGACGYKEVDKAPFHGMTSCGNIPIFKDGRGCGSCFELKCTKPEACSGEPTMVTITGTRPSMDLASATLLCTWSSRLAHTTCQFVRTTPEDYLVRISKFTGAGSYWLAIHRQSISSRSVLSDTYKLVNLLSLLYLVNTTDMH